MTGPQRTDLAHASRNEQTPDISAKRIGDPTMTAVIQPTGEVRESIAPGARLQHLLHRRPALGPATVLVASCIVFSLLNSRFINPVNLSLIIQQVAVVGALAVGQTMIILTGGIDLSVGAAMILAQMVMAQTAANNAWPGPTPLLLCAPLAALPHSATSL